MLENYANNLIMPAYEQLFTKTQDLKNTWELFLAAPDLTGLENTQDAWEAAYLAWQAANAYNFGPAEEVGLNKSLVEEIGVFPVDAAGIENYLSQGATDLNNADRDTRGFLAIEYLLFRSTNDVLLNELQATDRQNYLTAIIDHLNDKLEAVVNAWPAFKNEFIENNGTSVGTSTSVLYNEFIRSYETIKNFKVGLPAGKQAGQTGPEPDLVESRYAHISLQTLKAHLQTIDAIYYGKGLNGEGIGLHEYLQNVVGGPELITSLEIQWANVQAALANVPTDRNFFELVEEEDASISALHTELQKHTRFFKSDMSSLLGLAITFSSNDGD
ncbi:MAG: iron-regulated protein A precursor [Saprospiraceae bacterium]|nr:MAG: iron-regulated protein A precursor [Saprospiraceae bacterium]